jgi:hypothetical protein
MATKPLTDTGSLKPYIANTLPQLGGGDKLFLSNELKKIQDAISGLIKAAQALEARLNAGGL